MSPTHAYTAQTTWASPLGELLLARTAQGLAGAWFLAGQKDAPGHLDAPEAPHDPLLQNTITALAAYFAGQPGHFQNIPLDLQGTAFQRTVWQALRGIAQGSLSTYGDIACAVGSPKAVRAVGGAVGRNPVSVIVPCHRVVGRDGSLTGYSGGMDRKRALLQLEGTLSATHMPRVLESHLGSGQAGHA